MDQKRFITIVTEAINTVSQLIQQKNVGKYSTTEDALHNFRVVAEKRQKTLGEALQGMADKHQVIVDDMISGVMPITEELISEHAVDFVTYALLNIPVLYEMMDEQNAEREVIKTIEGTFKKAEECDDCSEQDKGYDRAVKVLLDYTVHLHNRGDERMSLCNQKSVLELRKER